MEVDSYHLGIFFFNGNEPITLTFHMQGNKEAHCNGIKIL